MLPFSFVIVRYYNDFSRFSKQEAAWLENKAQGAIYSGQNLTCMVCISEPPPRGSSPRVDHYLCICSYHNQ
ncbi:hypothetical protein HanRHA438_Chr12g0567041 [Helianthus annuus]|nr:hypothetical protein HanRHA438_Chr12g0567041 [Helianthus annuus]